MSVAAQSLLGCGNFFFWLALGLFGVAGTFSYEEAWVFLGLVIIGISAITLYLFLYDRPLLARRMKAGFRAEQHTRQKVLLLLAPVVFATVVFLPALAFRLRWPSFSGYTEMAGLVLVAFGMAVVWSSFHANSFAGATIKISKDQCVIESGPYALVRHPMYTGILLSMTGAPLALGSWLGFLGLPSVGLVLALRSLWEEEFLREHLTGYDAYCRKTRWRIVPFIF